MRGTVKHIGGGMVALQTEGGLVAVETKREASVGEEMELGQLVHIGTTEKGTPKYRDMYTEKVEQMGYDELCLAGIKILLTTLLDKEIEEVEFLVHQMAAKTRDAKKV